MMSLPREYAVFGILAGGIIVLSLFLGSPFWYINLLLLVLLLCIMLGTHTWHDRGFYLLCGGVPVVIASSSMNLWAGVFAACTLAGMIAIVFGIGESTQDLKNYAVFCGSSLLVALIIQISNHAVVPLIAFAGVTALILAVYSVRRYQFHKHLSGAEQ